MAELGTDTATAQAGEAQETEVSEIAATAADDAGEGAAKEAKDGEQKPEGEKPISDKSKDRIERKIGRLTAEARKEAEARHKAELEAAELRGRLAALEGKEGKKAEDDGPPKKPVALDYENTADFNEALSEYADRMIAWHKKDMQANVDKRLEEVTKTSTKTTADPEAERNAQLQKRVEEVTEKLEEEFGEDAVDVLLHDKAFSLTTTMRDEIIHEKGENAHKILGYLIENPKVADKIAALSPGNQIREIDKLEAALTAKKGSGAPPPLKDVSGKGGSGPVDPKKMTDAEWKEWDRKKKLSSA